MEIIDQPIQQLQSMDPRQRRRAVIALAKARDAAALPLLHQLAHNDPDEAIQNLARKAISYLQRQTHHEPDFLAHLPLLPARSDDGDETQVNRQAAVDLALFMLVNVLAGIGMALLGAPKLALLLSQSMDLAAPNGQLQYMLSYLHSAQTGELMTLGIVWGILTAALSILLNRLAHFAAVYVFRGYNTFAALLQQTLNPQSIMTLAGTLALLLVVLALDPTSNHLIGFFLAWLLLCAALIGSLLWYSWLVGSIYGIGIIKGFLATLTAFMLYGVGAVVIRWLIAL